jgi:uncharacterized membrane protein
MVLTCPQCGATGWLTPTRRRWRRSGFWCERCQAPVPAAGVARRGTTTEPSTADGATAPVDGLRAIMPAPMIGWVLRRHRGQAPARLDRPVVYQLYRTWDAATGSGLPAFSAVVGTLHAAAYDLDAAYPPATTDPAVRERAVHARAWLREHAPGQCWILGEAGEAGDPADRDAVRAALAAIAAGTEPTPAQARAARHALFGVDSGPGLRTLRAVFGDQTLTAALGEYLERGGQPLRATVLANLGATAADR